MITVSTATSSNVQITPVKRGRILWIKRILLAVIVLIFALPTTGIIYELVMATGDAERYPAPGQMVAVDGHQMHLNCVGTVRPNRDLGKWLQQHIIGLGIGAAGDDAGLPPQRRTPCRGRVPPPFAQVTVFGGMAEPRVEAAQFAEAAPAGAAMLFEEKKRAFCGFPRCRTHTRIRRSSVTPPSTRCPARPPMIRPPTMEPG